MMIKAATGCTILSIASVSVTLCLLEVALRCFYPQPIHYYNFTRIQSAAGAEMVLGHRLPTVSEKLYGYGPYVPNLVTTFAGVQMTINSRGWRDTEHVVAKRKNVTRIMVVGDSVTFGYGVELEDSFSKILEREVNRGGAGHWEVMTFGGAAANTYSQKNIIESLVRLYKPDWVIIAFNLNDILPKITKTPNSSSPDRRRPLARTFIRLRRTLDAAFRSRSHLYFLVREKSKAVLRQFGIASPAMVPLAAFDIDTEYALSAWRDTSGALLEIATTLRNEKIPLLLAVLPIDIQMSAEVADLYRRQFGFKFADSLVEGKPQKILCEFARQHGIACLDLLSAFRKDPDDNKFFRIYGGSVDWNHPNRAGHRIIGEELAKVLKSFARSKEFLKKKFEPVPALRKTALTVKRPQSRPKAEETQ
jgi:lysophospholipase L1-like esterase